MGGTYKSNLLIRGGGWGGGVIFCGGGIFGTHIGEETGIRMRPVTITTPPG